MKIKFLTGLIVFLLILGASHNASADLLDWTITFDSTLGTSGNVANFEYTFAVDTDALATQTQETASSISIINPYPSDFYAEYVSKNGVEKGFNYRTFGVDDSLPLDRNLALYLTPTHLYIETFEDNANKLYLNLYFDSNDFGADLSQATALSLSEMDNGVPYFARNVSADHFTVSPSSAVPEPATMLLFGTGLFGFAFRKQKF